MLNTMQRKSVVALSALFVLGAMSGCATNQAPAAGKTESAPAAMKTEATAQKQTYFMVFHENGRIYVMTEPKNLPRADGARRSSPDPCPCRCWT